ncbi:MAG: peptidase M19 [Sulfobacillus benefaciens]|uniref:Peptidase M19 n=1 Tax=Sulfobacillus benefaciens TaxID=453960 RepID=A0A2T2XM16_9FIRM|nr:MAG: peptidase M19 [Sulfobacillus benefaciens]
MMWRGHWVPVVDTHADSMLDVVYGRRHLGERSDSGQLDIPRALEGGLTIQCFSCWIEPEYKPERALSRQLQFFDRFWQEANANTETLAVITDGPSLEAALASNRLGAIISVEGAEALGTDPGLVRIFHRLGVRLMSLTWNERNALADGAGEDPGGGGVSKNGRQIIGEMERVGIILDVSHLSEASFWDVMEIRSRPVIASHSNCRELALHPRNLSDAQMRALAGQGGVQGITFVRDFLGRNQDLDRVVDHMLYAMDIVGDSLHLGLGSDFDGVENPVPGLEDVTHLPQLADHMSDRGISDPDVENILGGNYVRFLRSYWAAEQSRG